MSFVLDVYSFRSTRAIIGLSVSGDSIFQDNSTTPRNRLSFCLWACIFLTLNTTASGSSITKIRKTCTHEDVFKIKRGFEESCSKSEKYQPSSETSYSKNCCGLFYILLYKIEHICLMTFFELHSRTNLKIDIIAVIENRTFGASSNRSMKIYIQKIFAVNLLENFVGEHYIQANNGF